MKKVIIIILVIIVIVVGYFIYRSSYSTKAPLNSSESIASDTIIAKNSVFNPNELTVNVGTEITFKNDDSIAHTFTGDGFESGDVKSGDSFKFTFNTAGTFNYHCSIHPSMTGKIIVK